MSTVTKDWADMSAEERRAKRIDDWRHPAIEWDSPETEADYKARIDRIVTAITLSGTPDRVPISLNTGFWPAVWGA